MNLADEREMLRILRTRQASPAEEALLVRLLKQREDERAKQRRKRKAQGKSPRAVGGAGESRSLPHRPQGTPP